MSRGAPRPGSVVQVTDAEGRIREQHAFTCCHCGKVRMVPPDAKIETVSDICRSCWKLHCLDQDCCDRCAPFMKRIEAAEARHHSLRSMGLA